MITSLLNSLFLWFYCLPLEDAAMAVALVTVLFLLLRQRFGTRRLWKGAVNCLLLVWLGAMLWRTVLGRGDGESQGVVLMPFHSYWTVLRGGEIELLRTNFMNLLLFFPAGLLLADRTPNTLRPVGRLLLAVTVLGALSVGIELCQYLLKIGRTETDDVLHNALGGALGGWMVLLFEQKMKSR